MGDGDLSFAAIVVAGLTMLVGTKLLVSSMIELLSVRGGTVQLLLDSVAVTTLVGIVLLVTTGGLVAHLRWSRYLAIVALVAVTILGRPTLADPEPALVIQTTIAVLTVLYLLVRNPTRRERRSDIDESRSATKVGSTIE